MFRCMSEAILSTLWGCTKKQQEHETLTLSTSTVKAETV
jgi:hypothetical protein